MADGAGLQKSRRVNLVKARRKLIYSALLFALSVLLLLALTYSWMVRILMVNSGGVSLLVDKADITLSRSVDNNGDGLPDLDVNGGTVYLPTEDHEVVISRLFPGAGTAFRLEVTTGASGGSVTLRFLGVSAPTQGQPDPAAYLRLQYTDPSTGSPVDVPLASVLDANRNTTVLGAVHVTANTRFTFEYRFTFDGAAGNEYQSSQVSITQVAGSFTAN